MKNLNKTSLNFVAQINDERQHLKQTIPRTLLIQTIGNPLTEQEWKKFCMRHLIPKLQHCCERKHDGSIHFFGEFGLNAALILQHKFKGRFHFVLNCDSSENACRALFIARELDLKISEVHYKNSHNETIHVNDKEQIEKMADMSSKVTQFTRKKLFPL